MKIRIDFSVFTSGGDAVGHVVGNLEFVTEPMIGDTISLTFAPSTKSIPAGHEFGGQLKVVDRIFSPAQDKIQLSLMLSDMVAGTRDQALHLMSYVDSEFGLQTNLYGE